jgi:3-oxoacyl-[acyl-carrier-protein] synthase-3
LPDDEDPHAMTFHAPLRIAGVGRYLPERVVPSTEIDRRCGLKPGTIEKKTGVRERRWVDGETNSVMAGKAAREALAEARLDPSEIDLILNASGTAEQAIPDGAPLVQRELDLGMSGIPCLSLHATCLSFLVALDVAGSLLAANRYHTILIVASDIASCGLNFGEWESAGLFGDGAAAAVVVKTPDGGHSRLHAARLETFGQGAYLTAIHGGGTRRHPANPETKPEDNLFHMEGTRVYKMAAKRFGPFLEKLRPGLSGGLGDIDLVLPHQASLFAVRTLRLYGIPDEKVVVNLDRYGNCIAASIPLALVDAVRAGRLRRGDKALLVGTGAGLSIGGIILTY